MTGIVKDKRVKRKYEDCHKIVNGIEYKLCSKCDEWLPLNSNHYYKNKSANDGYNPYCKQCTVKKTMEWEKNNPDKVKVSRKRTNDNRKEKLYIYNQVSKERGVQREWRIKNADKVSEYQKGRYNKNHKIKPIEWELCKEYFNNECSYCGLLINDHYIVRKGVKMLGDFHKEHVDHNGSNKLDNCVPSCRDCNSSKHKRELNEWYNENNINYTYDRINKILDWLEEDHKYIIIE